MNAFRQRKSSNASAGSASTNQTSRGGNKINIIKKLAKPQRVFGDRCFDYISTCKHKLPTAFTARIPKKHDIYAEPEEDEGTIKNFFVDCPFCRLINVSTQAFFEQENIQKAIARNLSLKNRSLLRTKLLYQWSQSQSYHYQYMEMDICMDLVLSISLTNSIVKNEALLTLVNAISPKKKHHRLLTLGKAEDEDSGSTRGKGQALVKGTAASQAIDNEKEMRKVFGSIPAITTGGATVDAHTASAMESITVINFEDLYLRLSRNKRISEVGQLGAIYLQAKIRRMITRIKTRQKLLKRFEFVPLLLSQKLQPNLHNPYNHTDYFFDQIRLHRWGRYPKLLQNERPATPRTIDRRIKYENKQKEEKLSFFQQYLKNFEHSFMYNIFTSINFIDQDIILIKYFRQLIVLRDLILLIMVELNKLEEWKQLKHEEEGAHGSGGNSMDALHHLTAGGSSGKSSKGNAAGAAGNRRNSKAGHQGSQSHSNGGHHHDEKTNPLANMHPVWIVPTAPGLPARELGLALAMMTTVSPASSGSAQQPVAAQSAGSSKAPMNHQSTVGNLNRANSTRPPGLARQGTNVGGPAAGGAGGGAGAMGNITPLHRALQILEQNAYEELKCYSPEEVIQKLLISDIIPIYESILNFSLDEFHIWDPGYLKKTPQSAVGTATTSNQPQTNAPKDKYASLASKYGYGLTEEDIAEQEKEKELERKRELELQQLKEKEEKAKQYAEQIKLKHQEILPFGYQLRIWNDDHLPNGLFRIFFYESEMIGITAVSPWVFYPEVSQTQPSV